MASVLEKLITADEFEQMPEGAGKRELVNGEVIDSMPPGAQHGMIAALIAIILSNWMAQRGGYVGVEAGFVLTRDPDTVRGPDVSYISASHLPASGIPVGFWNQAPDLAVEVISPSETAEEVRAKVRDLFMAGTPLVWTVYPATREVIVHTPDGLARTYGPDATLEFPDLLPGFSCPVAALFA